LLYRAARTFAFHPQEGNVIHKATLALFALSLAACSHATVHEVCSQDLDHYPALTTSDGRTATPREVCLSARTDEVTRYCVEQWDKNRWAHYGSFADCYADRQQQLRPASKPQKTAVLAQTDDEDDDNYEPHSSARYWQASR
jgi:hypothetical protein